jgi:short-subunit dehydrogenase
MWKDKVVLITGSSMGIGKNLALELGRKEAKIVLNGRNKDRLLKLHNEFNNKGINSIAIAGDISVYEDCVEIVNQIISTFGQLDVLVNNAGIATMSSIENMNPEIFKKVIDVNLNGSVFMTKAALPSIKKTKGSILFVGSIAGIHGVPDYSAYSCSKMALTAFVEALQIELNNTGIYIGHAYVGFTENDPDKTFLTQSGEAESIPLRNTVKQMPVKKLVARLIKMIEKKQTSVTFSFVGKLNNIVNRISPKLVCQILLKRYLSDNEKKELPGTD